jgi:2'-5' RNA ligase
MAMIATNDCTRMFLALWPEPQVRDALRQWQDGWEWPRRASPVKPERLHLTLHFLGDVPNSMLPALAERLRVPFGAFELGFGEAGLWPNGVAVLEPGHVPQALLVLHAALGDVLLGLGLPVDPRPFRPHVTLARRASGAQVPLPGPEIRWQVREYALMSSSPALGYSVLQRYLAAMPQTR